MSDHAVMKKFYEAVVEAQPKNANAHYDLAGVYLLEGKYADALELLFKQGKKEYEREFQINVSFGDGAIAVILIWANFTVSSNGMFFPYSHISKRVIKLTVKHDKTRYRNQDESHKKGQFGIR